MKKNESIKIGMIGLGAWGKNILRNLKELNVVAMACDDNLKVINERKKDFPQVNYTTDVYDILDDRDITAVVIATPAATHYQLTKLALTADKDVFVEKPLALTYAEGKELYVLAKSKNKILMVGHILQYHPAAIKLKELIEQGRLGKIQYLYSNRLNIGKLRVEENILWSFAPHDISLILMLVGDEPTQVTCFGDAYLNKGIYDSTLTALEFKSDIKAHIFVSWLHPFKEQKLVVIGSKAMVVFDDLTKEKLFIYPHRIEWTEGRIPVAMKAEYEVVPVETKEPLREEIQHFLQCITERIQPKTDGEEGLRVLKILEQAENSIKGQSVSIKTQKTRDYFVHPTAEIDDNVKIGVGTKIWHFSHILKNTEIGKNCVIGQNVMIGPDVKVGDNCKIQNNVSLYKGVILEDNVFCGPSCVFTNVYNPRSFIERKNEILATFVKTGASIGANATIVCGTAIGKYAFIGAGAVVKKDVIDYAIMAGVPAKQVGWMCKCGVTLREFNKDNTAVCKSCGSKYSKQNDKLFVIEEKI